MSKKPVPKKQQCKSSTRSRYAKYQYKKRVKLENQAVTDKCPNCDATKRRHFACGECGFYNGRVAVETAQKDAPAAEIAA